MRRNQKKSYRIFLLNSNSFIPIIYQITLFGIRCVCAHIHFHPGTQGGHNLHRSSKKKDADGETDMRRSNMLEVKPKAKLLH